MEKFLKKIEDEINTKLIASVSGTVLKKEDKVFNEVRKQNNKNRTTKSHKEKGKSIYDEIIGKFLKENPEFVRE